VAVVFAGPDVVVVFAGPDVVVVFAGPDVVVVIAGPVVAILVRPVARAKSRPIAEPNPDGPDMYDVIVDAGAGADTTGTGGT